MKLVTKDTWGRTNSYEIVDKIPPRFFVWNIGKNIGDKNYVALCEWRVALAEGVVREDYSVNTDTVKAIRLTEEEAAVLSDAAHYGANCVKNARRIKSTLPKKKALNWWDQRKLDYAKQALPIFERITA